MTRMTSFEGNSFCWYWFCNAVKKAVQSFENIFSLNQENQNLDTTWLQNQPFSHRSHLQMLLNLHNGESKACPSRKHGRKWWLSSLFSRKFKKCENFLKRTPRQSCRKFEPGLCTLHIWCALARHVTSIMDLFSNQLAQKSPHFLYIKSLLNQ